MSLGIIHMKRIVLSIALLVATLDLFAFDRTQKRVSTLGVLTTRGDDNWARDESLARAVEARLVAELRERGFDAVQTRTTWEDESRSEEEPAYDVLVEISSPRARHESVAGVIIGGRAGAADVSVVHSHASAVVHVYDGRTLEPLDHATTVERSASGVMPTGIAVGDRHFGLWISLPFARYARQRALAQAIAEEAAEKITNALQDERRE